MPTPLSPQGPDSPVSRLRAALIMTAAYVGSSIAVPPNARRVTFHMRMTKGAGAGNRARFALGWEYLGFDDTKPLTDAMIAHESREPQTEPASLAVVGQEAIMPVHFGAWNGPLVNAASPTQAKWHETFEVPAGVSKLTLYAMEILDVANFPILAVDVAFSGAL